MLDHAYAPVFASYNVVSRPSGATNAPAARGVGKPAAPLRPGTLACWTSEAGFPPCRNLQFARKHEPRLKSPHSCEQKKDRKMCESERAEKGRRNLGGEF
eukprot:scaffold110489_cov31-Tisochrysis_lutea.AAC.1